ncbi:unnamed protein product [Phytophthora lilii]|uniref:Unnamed protein product n=1 Tax=Phytophthora lilii TaxID=2077276 RepID=A0A9W6TSA6_9STRA|nr:unnamed protein product [Phytophthora lilii]
MARLTDSNSAITSAGKRLNDVDLAIEYLDTATMLLINRMCQNSSESLSNLSLIISSACQDARFVGSNSSSDNDEPNTSEKQKQKYAMKCRAYRRRQKATREELKRQVIELSEALSRLQQSKRTEQAILATTREPSFHLWRDFAIRERTERMCAEERQQQQAMYIDTLRKVLGKRVGCSLDSGFYDGSQKRHCSATTEADDSAPYICELETKYHQIDEVLGARNVPHFLDLWCQVNSVYRRHSDGKVEYFQHLSKVVLPSSLDEANRSFWKIGEQQFCKKPNFVRHNDVKDPKNTTVVTFVEEDILPTGDCAETRAIGCPPIRTERPSCLSVEIYFRRKWGLQRNESGRNWLV